MAAPGDKHSTTVLKRISQNVLQMNFMKRTTNQEKSKRKLQQQQTAIELIRTGKALVQPPLFYPVVEHIDDDPNWTLGGIMSEWRYTVLQEQRFGRFSFNGQNPEVEKWMIFYERQRLGLHNDTEERGDGEDTANEEEELEEGEIPEPSKKKSKRT